MSRLETGVKGLFGQNIEVAVAKLGYPAGQREMMGNTIYTWSTASSGAMMLPQTSTAFGNVGGVPYNGTGTTYSYVPVSYACTVELVVDSSGTIIAGQWNGNPGGCSSYASALN